MNRLTFQNNPSQRDVNRLIKYLLSFPSHSINHSGGWKDGHGGSTEQGGDLKSRGAAPATALRRFGAALEEQGGQTSMQSSCARPHSADAECPPIPPNFSPARPRHAKTCASRGPGAFISPTLPDWPRPALTRGSALSERPPRSPPSTLLARSLHARPLVT